LHFQSSGLGKSLSNTLVAANFSQGYNRNMPVAFVETIDLPAPQSPRRKRWTRAECEILDSLGLLAGEHLELIDGELINKKGRTSRHVISGMLLHEWLVGIFEFWHVLSHETIDVAPRDNPSNEPEPDLVVLRESFVELKARPQPENVLLVIEVADSTLSFDLATKAPLYARAGIPEYWVLDVNNRRFIVHREPIDGTYTSVLVYHEEESVAPLAAPRSEFRVAAAFEE
jgi:Uma2 family endonuclease